MGGVTTSRKILRTGLNILWGVVMLVVLAACTFGGMLGGAYLGYDLLPGAGFLLAVGAFTGVAVALVVNHKSRDWLMRARMRDDGVRAEATVVRCERRYTVGGGSGPGNTLYTVYVRWDGVTRERQYRFNGRDTDFEPGREVTVRYPEGRPHRFLIELPYAPMMVDFFI
jgi:hypothetical protein